ncbi:MAG: helix-turn-helix domain-containing protein [Candidatus Bruticola sp.]
MARSERITLQEASELSGVSIPTIYRRIRSGELKGAICIDAGGKHWELFKSDLEKLTLKRKKRSSSVTLGNSEDTTSVQVAEQLKPDDSGNSDNCTSSGLGDGSGFIADADSELIQLRKRCAELEENEKELQRALEAVKDEASYWHGRCDQISLDFETLRQVLLDKTNDDQELIWNLREQVADLQENLGNTQAYYSELTTEIGSGADGGSPSDYSLEEVQSSEVWSDIEPSVCVKPAEENSEGEVSVYSYDDSVSSAEKDLTADLVAEVDSTGGSVNSEAQIGADSVTTPPLIDETVIKLSDSYEYDSIQITEQQEEETEQLAAAKTDVILATELNGSGEGNSSALEYNESKSGNYGHKVIKYEMNRRKGRNGRKGRKRIPPLR